MGLKRHFGNEGSNSSHMARLASQPEGPAAKFQKVVKDVMKEASLEEMAVRISALLEPTIRRVVTEEFQALILQSSPLRYIAHPHEPSVSRGLQLYFRNKLPSTIFTNSAIRDEEQSPLQILLVDGRSNKLVQHGSLSSMKVEILVLSADFTTDGREDWSETEFGAGIVREREGKRPLLVGDLSCTLVDGVGFIGNVSFTDNSSWVRSRRFRLGVRAVSRASKGAGIREAVSDAFVVLDHRGESYQKHSTPYLPDPVWRLRKISKVGASRRKLESYGVKTVKDFLMMYYTNPDALRNVLGKGVSNRAWETMVKHATECHLDDTQYSYYNAAERIELRFNCVYKLTSVNFDGQNYMPADFLEMSQKVLVDKLKHYALRNLNELVLLPGPSGSTSITPSITQQDVPFYGGLDLDMQHDGFSIIDQGIPEQKLEYNNSESASYPCTVESARKLEDDSTAQSDQPVVQAFFMTDSAHEASHGGYNWLQDTPLTTFSLTEPSDTDQTLPLYPLSMPMTWGQAAQDGHSTTSTAAAHTGIYPQLSGFMVINNDNSNNNNRSHNSSLTAGWCMIRAVVMWKIVRRRAAAKRRPNFPYWWC